MTDLSRDRPSDHGRRDVVQFEDPEDLLDVLREHGEHHALLALRDPDFPGSETFLFQRHLLQVDLCTEPSREGHFADDTREASSAEVLHPGEEAGLRRLDASVDQRFLEDRIAELDGPGFPSSYGAIGQIAARIRHPVDPVAPGLAATQDEDVPHGGRAVSYELGLFREPDAGDVHDYVAEVSFVEDNATRDRRNPDSVAVITNPRDDPAEEILRVSHPLRQLLQRIVQGTEMQRIC